jgi:hypothetical protein
MPPPVHILFGAALTITVSLLLGRMLLRGLGIRCPRVEEEALAFPVGAALLSLLVFLAASAGVARKGVFLGLSIAVLVAALLTRAWRVAPAAGPSWFPNRWWKYAFLAVVTAFGAVYFINAMAPEFSPDGSTYHLGLVARYVRERGILPITTNMYANISQGVEMLYLFAFVFGKHSAAALVHLGFLVGALLAIMCWGRRSGHPVAGLGAALLFFVSPVVGRDATTAYNDVAVALIVFATFFTLELWAEDRRPALLVAVGILAGFAYAAKYTAFVAVPYALAYVAWKQRRARPVGRGVVCPLAIVACCAMVMMLPWIAKNWIWLGNPFSPFFNRFFPNPYVHVSFERDYARHMRNYVGLRSHWDIPLEVTVRGRVLGGVLGPVFLLAPLALLALRRPAGRRALLAAAVFGAPFAANIGTRFLIPCLPLLCLALAIAASQWKAALPTLIAAHALLSWHSVLSLYEARYAWRIERVPLRQALRLESEDSWLGRKHPEYVIARMVEDHVEPGARVFAFSQIAEAYTSREIIVSYASALGQTLSAILWTPTVPEWQPRICMRFSFPPRILQKVRVTQTAEADPDHWTVSEMRIYRSGVELPRNPRWTLRAHPNIWDVQMAFDNNPVTRWSTWEAARPWMFLEADFRGDQQVSGVELDQSPSQYRVRLKLEGLDQEGVWQVLSDKPDESVVTPRAGYRGAAVAELKERGIRYVLVLPEDFGAGDFQSNARQWGMTEVAERGGVRLYRIL